MLKEEIPIVSNNNNKNTNGMNPKWEVIQQKIYVIMGKGIK